ncbi:MAG: hypothetical protein MJA83_03420 [Gammaproteobacteria bacterium]|nr:hypothetical protein [Gammaproteobacteria bacterium]
MTKVEDIQDEVLYELTNKWNHGINLQVDTGDPVKGFEHRPLASKGTTDVYGWQMTDQLLSLLREWRDRKPVLLCVPVNHAARANAAAKAAKQKEIDTARKLALKKKLKEQKAAEQKKETKRAMLIAQHLAGQVEPVMAATAELSASPSTKPRSKKAKRKDSAELSPSEVEALERGEDLPK